MYVPLYICLTCQICLIQKGSQLKPLFEVTELLTSCHDEQIDFRAEMIEKQKTYGILLHACDLMEMTDDRVEKETMDMREKLFIGNWVRIKHLTAYHCKCCIHNNT